MSLYLDEYTLGQEFKTPARTFTEADTVLFGCLTGDLHPNHFDREKMARRYKDLVIDNAAIDDILLLYVKGDVLS